MPVRVVTTQAEIPRHIVRQLAAAAPYPGGPSVELRLNPEELGRVQMSLVQGDGTISVTILAERGETLDLMRRHIALLENEFRDIGFDDIQFAFGSAGQHGGNTQPGPDQEGPADLAPQTKPDHELAEQSAPSRRTQAGPAGLDLRL